MEVIHLNDCTDEFIQRDSAVLALGFFDGVHLGHKKLIRKAGEIASKEKLELAVMTFYPHPKEILAGKKFNYLMSLNEKVAEMRKLGVDRMYVVDFTIKFSQLSPIQFINQYIKGLNVKHVVAGFDYSFGHMGKGNMALMQQHSIGDFGVTVLPAVVLQDEKISSTRIRQLLMNGNIKPVKDNLGKFYETKGTLQINDLIKSDIKYRSVTFTPVEKNMLPKPGTYMVRVRLANRLIKAEASIASVGDNEYITVKTNNINSHIGNGIKASIIWMDAIEKRTEDVAKEIVFS